MSGVIPAIPLILIRPFLPESPVWRERRAAGTLKRPSIRELFSAKLRPITVVSTLMLAMAYGSTFGALQQVPQMLAGVPQIQEQTRNLPPPDAAAINQRIAARMTLVGEVGGLLGRVLLALLIVRIASRRTLVRSFQIPGMVIYPLVFAVAATTNINWLYAGVFLAGLCSVGQFSFWGNYLPRVYPTHLRGTGESFAANVGGRMIGTCAALVTTGLVPSMPGGSVPIQLAYASAIVGTAAFLGGFIASFWLPEPKQTDLPD
jgi:MFS family permease